VPRTISTELPFLATTFALERAQEGDQEESQDYLHYRGASVQQVVGSLSRPRREMLDGEPKAGGARNKSAKTTNLGHYYLEVLAVSVPAPQIARLPTEHVGV
jgi:hypothetical protein